MHRPFLFALISMSRATKKFIDGHLFLDEDRLDEKEAQRRNIPMHVFNGFLEQLARDVEQLALLKAQKLPTAQHEATLDNLRRHQSVLELRFLPRSLSAPLRLPFSLSLFPSLSFSLFSPSSLTGRFIDNDDELGFPPNFVHATRDLVFESSLHPDCSFMHFICSADSGSANMTIVTTLNSWSQFLLLLLLLRQL